MEKIEECELGTTLNEIDSSSRQQLPEKQIVRPVDPASGARDINLINPETLHSDKSLPKANRGGRFPTSRRMSFSESAQDVVLSSIHHSKPITSNHHLPFHLENHIDSRKSKVNIFVSNPCYVDKSRNC